MVITFDVSTSPWTKPMEMPPMIAPGSDSRPPNRIAGNAINTTVERVRLAPVSMARSTPPAVAIIPAIAQDSPNTRCTVIPALRAKDY